MFQALGSIPSMKKSKNKIKFQIHVPQDSKFNPRHQKKMYFLQRIFHSETILVTTHINLHIERAHCLCHLEIYMHLIVCPVM